VLPKVSVPDPDGQPVNKATIFVGGATAAWIAVDLAQLHRISATPTDYPTSSISSVADAQQLVQDSDGNFIGKNEQCASLTHALSPELPSTTQWLPGDKVQGDTNIPVGTPVATFAHIGEDGTNGYGPSGNPAGLSGESHTGIYLGQDSSGMSLLSQWSGSDGPQIRTIPWGEWNGHPHEGGSSYYTIDY